MAARANALERENAQLRVLLMQRDQETAQLRSELRRLQGDAGPPPVAQLVPPVPGGPQLPALAAGGLGTYGPPFAGAPVARGPAALQLPPPFPRG